MAHQCGVGGINLALIEERFQTASGASEEEGLDSGRHSYVFTTEDAEDQEGASSEIPTPRSGRGIAIVPKMHRFTLTDFASLGMWIELVPKKGLELPQIL